MTTIKEYKMKLIFFLLMLMLPTQIVAKTDYDLFLMLGNCKMLLANHAVSSEHKDSLTIKEGEAVSIFCKKGKKTFRCDYLDEKTGKIINEGQNIYEVIVSSEGIHLLATKNRSSRITIMESSRTVSAIENVQSASNPFIYGSKVCSGIALDKESMKKLLKK